jgi:hypothetical protein
MSYEQQQAFAYQQWAQQQQAFAQQQAQQPPQGPPEWTKGDLAIPDAEINKYKAIDETRIELELYKKAAVSVITALQVDANKNVLLPLEMRQTGVIDPASEAVFSATQANILLFDMSNLVKAVTDDQTMRCLANLAVKLQPGGEGVDDDEEDDGEDDSSNPSSKKSHSQTPKLRPFFETSPATTQCNNTVGGFTVGVTPCWICGGIITTQAAGHPLRPECEHIFPVAQALCFTGLYESSLMSELVAENKSMGAAYTQGLYKEYRWAHRVCNQIKNDKHFVSIVKNADGTQTFDANDVRILEMLNLIITTQKYGGGGESTGSSALRKLLTFENIPNGENEWKQLRGTEIRKRVMEILDRVTALGLTPEQHAKNTIMNMRCYISRSPACVLTVEQEMKTPAFAISGEKSLTLETSQQDFDKAKSITSYFITMLGNAVTDAVSRLLRVADLETTGRALKLRSFSLDLGNRIGGAIFSKITPLVIQTIRHKVANLLYARSTIGGISLPRQEFSRSYGINCDGTPLRADQDDPYCPTGPETRQTIALDSPLKFWGFYQQWNLGVLRESIRQEVKGEVPAYVGELKAWWDENMKAASATRSAQTFVFDGPLEQEIMKNIHNELSRTAVTPDSFPGTTFDEIQAQPIIYSQAHLEKNIAGFSKWFGARRRKSRKSKSKKQKTLRRKRLF